ncbi:acetyltransferase [Paraburkholderia sp. D15]|uniref:acetyltransferase n=1 Tax=Paraburkholderia sp. D15 TaxID=2880218 RepID=UPI002478A3A5|nr:acetyltransferase [Paraburkholderia sp. D15]WGS52255.1 acetyltransferase [Paraburkholderia sp. D15]
MNVTTSDDFIGVLPNHRLSKLFIVLGYRDGTFSAIPNKFFRDWTDEEPPHGTFNIGRCTCLGVGSIAKYDAGLQNLSVGKYVSGGLRVKFLLNGQHEIRTISTSMFAFQEVGLSSPPQPQHSDMIVHNDVWIGDETMILGGSVIESGCVLGARALIPPNFRTEPYGIYVGSPARLVRFRFPEKVREKLLELKWWDQPLAWLKKHNQAFLTDLSADEGRALEILTELQRDQVDQATA